MKKKFSLLLAIALLLMTVPGMAELKLPSGKDTYPLQTEESVSWYVGTGYRLHDSFASWEESPFHRNLSEQVGVNIDWSFPTVGADENAAFNLLMAGGEMPDIIYFDISKDAQRYIDDGQIWDITPYIEEYAPAYYSFIKSDENYDKVRKTDNGQYYGFGFYREDGGWNDSYLGPVIRQDWLDETGLQAPETISDWENVMRTFKEKYGAQLSFAWSRFNTTGISGAFGAYGASDATYYVTADNKIQLAQAQPEWKEYAKKLAEWYKEGLIDQDIFSLDDTSIKGKLLADKVGISITSMGQLTNWINEAEEPTSGNGAKWTALQYPKGDDGTLSMIFGGTGIGPHTSFVTTNASEDKMKLALQVLDYAYTEEGNIFWNFGKEGESWQYNDKGEIEYMDAVVNDPDGLNNAIMKYGGSTWSGSCIQATRMLYLKNSQAGIDANDLWFYPNEAVSSNWKEPVGITFTTEESDEMDLYLNNINTYCQETFASIVTGSMDIDAEWENHLANLEGMDLARVLEIRQAAFDRYLTR